MKKFMALLLPGTWTLILGAIALIIVVFLCVSALQGARADELGELVSIVQSGFFDIVKTMSSKVDESLLATNIATSFFWALLGLTVYTAIWILHDILGQTKFSLTFMKGYVHPVGFDSKTYYLKAFGKRIGFLLLMSLTLVVGNAYFKDIFPSFTQAVIDWLIEPFSVERLAWMFAYLLIFFVWWTLTFGLFRLSKKIVQN